MVGRLTSIAPAGSGERARGIADPGYSPKSEKSVSARPPKPTRHDTSPSDWRTRELRALPNPMRGCAKQVAAIDSIAIGGGSRGTAILSTLCMSPAV
jgi:hypothetical protein